MIKEAPEVQSHLPWQHLWQFHWCPMPALVCHREPFEPGEHYDGGDGDVGHHAHGHDAGDSDDDHDAEGHE